MKPKRGEIYLIKRDNHGKQRPIVIVSNDTLNGGHSVVAVPFYSQQLTKRSAQQWCAMYLAGDGNLEKDSAAKTDEVSLIDKLDIDLSGGPIGKFNDEQMDRLIAALKWSLGIT